MVSAASLLATARGRAGLSQRQLSLRTGIAQASISRIERGLISPRGSTMERWLAACGLALDTRPLRGVGIDRTAIRERLAMSPAQRSKLGAQEAAAMLSLGRARLRRG